MENGGDEGPDTTTTSRRGRPRGSGSPEFKAWLKDTWPKAKPSQQYLSVATSRTELQLTISEVIKATTGKVVGPKTVANALNGRAVSDEVAAKIAAAIEIIYASPPSDADAPQLDLNGEWEVFYVEDDLTAGPTVTEERAFVTQNGSFIEGHYDCLSWARAYDFSFDGKISQKCVLGTYRVPGRIGPIGSGAFQLSAGNRNNEWLDGFCCWLDFDTGRIESSRCIWYKRAADYAHIYRVDVDRLMALEIEIMARRRRPLTS